LILRENFLDFFVTFSIFFSKAKSNFRWSKLLFHGPQKLYLDSKSPNPSLQVFLGFLEFLKYFSGFKMISAFSRIILELKMIYLES